MLDATRDQMENSAADLKLLEQQVAEHLKRIGAYQPLPYSKEENAQIAQDLYSYAYHFYENGKYGESTDFFKVLTQIEADKAHNWLGLAASLQMQKMHNEALLAYSTAIVLDPDNQTTYFHAANCCFALNHTSEGLRALEMAEQIAKNKPEQTAFLSQLALLRKVWSNNDKEAKGSNQN